MSTTRQITIVSRRGTTIFESTHTNMTAIVRLREAAKAGRKLTDFAHSLIAQYDQRGDLSGRQWPYVHKFAMDLDAAPVAAPAVEDLNLHGIVDLLDRAAAAGQGKPLKNPKIVVSIDGVDIKLSLAGDRARKPGTVNVTDLGSYGNNTWYGRILRDGKLEPSRNMTEAVRERLIALNVNPVGFAAEYGRLTGNCCFCNSGLKTPESTEAGYGPTCADNWGLPWGNKRREVAA